LDLQPEFALVLERLDELEQVVRQDLDDDDETFSPPSLNDEPLCVDVFPPYVALSLPF
jgi:hypothetical protein